jgi:hypothetical protein
MVVEASGLFQCVTVVWTVECRDIETVSTACHDLGGNALVLLGNSCEVDRKTCGVGLHRHSMVVGALNDEVVDQKAIDIKDIDVGKVAVAGDRWPGLQTQHPFQIGVGTRGAGG